MMTQAIQAPEPLLPNFGAGSSRPFMQDVEMMILLNGGERTLDELKALGYDTLVHTPVPSSLTAIASDRARDSSSPSFMISWRQGWWSLALQRDTGFRNLVWDMMIYRHRVVRILLQ